VAKRRTTARRIPKPREVRRTSLNRRDVTRAEYNHIIDVLNERNAILNGLRDGLQRLEHASDLQFKRIAQIQADLDAIKGAWHKAKLLA
jgi:hypothetical protein